MDSRFSTFKSALNRSADSMARTLPTTTAAFSLLPSWSNSIARFFAPTVRCSICDEDVASVRSNTALMGAQRVDLLAKVVRGGVVELRQCHRGVFNQRHEWCGHIKGEVAQCDRHRGFVRPVAPRPSAA